MQFAIVYFEDCDGIVIDTEGKTYAQLEEEYGHPVSYHYEAELIEEDMDMLGLPTDRLLTQG